MGWGHGWGRGGGYMWGGGGGGGILGIVGSLLGLLFVLGLLALVVLAAVWLLRRSPARASGTISGQRDTGEPLDAARRRLAAGEITLEQYDRIREELRR
jgi:uncharacterized membrane protein